MRLSQVWSSRWIWKRPVTWSRTGDEYKSLIIYKLSSCLLSCLLKLFWFLDNLLDKRVCRIKAQFLFYQFSFNWTVINKSRARKPVHGINKSILSNFDGHQPLIGSIVHAQRSFKKGMLNEESWKRRKPNEGKTKMDPPRSDDAYLNPSDELGQIF